MVEPWVGSVDAVVSDTDLSAIEKKEIRTPYQVSQKGRKLCSFPVSNTQVERYYAGSFKFFRRFLLTYNRLKQPKELLEVRP